MSGAPIVVCGMHRSGTSLVAGLLEAAGVHLGAPDELIPPASDNPAGFWEHERIVSVDDRLLAALGGAWDAPPRRPAGWAAADALGALRAEAERLVESLSMRDPWGFKDPRASLLLDFWADRCGPLRLVVCVRNPLEVARSLHARNGHSAALALGLWSEYDAAIRAAINSPGLLACEPVVVHARAVLDDPTQETLRISRHLGIAPDMARLERHLASRVDRGLRHHRLSGADLVTVGVSATIRGSYADWCERAGADDGLANGEPPASPPGPGRHVGEPSSTPAEYIGGLDVERLEYADLLSRYHVRGGHLALLEARLSDAATRIEALEAELATARRAVDEAGRTELSPTAGRLDTGRTGDRLEDVAMRLEAAAGDADAARAWSERRLRRLIEAMTEPGTRVGVAGGLGDAPHDRHLNVVPSDASVPLLALLAADGIDVVVVPTPIDADVFATAAETAGWPCMVDNEVATMWLTRPPVATVAQRLRDLCDGVELRTGRGASVLDLTDHGLGGALDDRAVVPVDGADPDRFLDGTVDVVVRSPAAGSDPAPDRRAAAATIELTPDEVRVVASPFDGRVPTVSLVLSGHHARFAEHLRARVPEWFVGEVIVADDDPGAELEEARGEILVSVAGAWLPEPGALAALVDALRHPSVLDRPGGMAVASVRRPDGSPLPLCHEGREVVPAELRWEARRAEGPLGGPVVAIQRAAWEEAGGLDPAKPVDVAWAELAGRLGADWPCLWVPESRWIGFGSPGAAVGVDR